MNVNLQLGDVLIFKAEESWVSKAIAMLTNSDVSHAAMYYGEAEMVEMGLSGIMVSNLNIGRGEAVYQLRLDPELDATPLIEAARVYVNAKTIYDLPALVLLGALLVYRNIRPSTQLYHVVDIILKTAVELLDKLLGQLLHGGDTGMVCSQLVYQVYQDCGGAYQLRVDGGILQNDLCGGVRLLDLRKEIADRNELRQQKSLPVDEELLARELYIALAESQAGEVPVGMEAAEFLTPAVSVFADLLEQLAKAVQTPLDALFVTPADLAYHTSNLNRVGELLVERIV